VKSPYYLYRIVKSRTPEIYNVYRRVLEASDDSWELVGKPLGYYGELEAEHGVAGLIQEDLALEQKLKKTDEWMAEGDTFRVVPPYRHLIQENA